MQVAYEITGRINERFSAITRYFSLAENNRLLAMENTRISNQLKQNFTVIDTSLLLKTDTTKFDSTRFTRKYFWRPATVINNSVEFQNNYITIQRGRLQGVEEDMAVIAPSGIVGLVTDVSDNMAIVMSLLHRKSNTSVALKDNGVTGILEWNGTNPNRLQLKGIPKSTNVKKGDTVLTSNISLNYPAGLLVGTIAEILTEQGGNNYILQIKPGANFYTLDQVSVIENVFLKEQLELERRDRKQ